MRKYILTAAMLAGFAAAGALPPSTAGAITISTPAALAKAAGDGNVSEVRYVCHRVWSHWGWRRSCFWRPGYAHYHHAYPYRHRYSYRSGYRYY
jgi:hypothetical protein